MNYFGIFFTFILPGLVLGALTAVVVQQECAKRARRAKRVRQLAAKGRLYVYDLNRDTRTDAA